MTNVKEFQQVRQNTTSQAFTTLS